jgi:hypothetical protein
MRRQVVAPGGAARLFIHTRKQKNMENESTWKDGKGRTWIARIDLGKAKAMRDNLGVDIMSADTANGIATLLLDRERLGDVLWLVHEPAATAKRIDRDDFYAALDYDALAAGFEAVVNAVSDFSDPASRQGILTMVRLQVEAMETVGRAIAEQIASAETEAAVQAAVTEELAATCG